jgi:hypothetical protein
MRFKVILFSLLILAGVLFFVDYKITPVNIYTAGQLNGQRILLELAMTPASQYQGLSDRQSLCADCGMLFIFRQSQTQTFVMRRMKFPLDMIWLNNNQIVGWSQSLAPQSSEPYTLYNSPKPVNQVLEVNADYVKNHNLKINDNLIYEKIK